MSTRRTRNNPSPSGLKSLPYGPKKRVERKTKQVSNSNTKTSSTSSTTKPPNQQPAPTKKRARAESKSDSNPPTKRRIVRSRQPTMAAEAEKQDEEAHDADDDEDGNDMGIVVQTSYSPPHHTAPFHAAENRLEARQQSEEFSSEEPRSEANNLEDLPQQQTSEEYDSQEPISQESASEDQHLEQSSRGYSSQAEHTSRDSTPAAPKPSKPEIASPASSFVHKPHFLTPKPRAKPKAATISYNKSVDPTTVDPGTLAKIVQRRDGQYQEAFTKTPPAQNTGLGSSMNQGSSRSSPRPLETRGDEQNEGDSDASFSFLDEPKLTASQLDSWREEQRGIREQLPQSPTGRTLIKRKPAGKVSQARPNAALALVKWAERDDTRRVPNSEQMEALLDNFNAQESTNVTARSPTHPPLSRVARNRRPEPKPAPKRPAQRRHFVNESSPLNHEANDGSGRASADDQSEVPTETQAPQTPAPQPQEPRGFWSGVSAVTSIFTSPLHFFDRRRHEQDSPAAATNGTSVTATSGANEIQDASQPTSLEDDFFTPRDPFARRALTPRQTSSRHEGNGQVPAPRDRRAQMERHRRQRDQPKPPIHLRGIVTPSRIAEIHRQQDRLAAARNKKREARAVEAEAEEELDNERSSVPSARTGEKRKRAKGAVRTPPAGPPGTFRVPSPGSSDDSSDEEVIPPQENGRIRYNPIPASPRRDLINDEVSGASPFTSLSGSPAATTAWKVPADFQPTYIELPKTSPKKAAAKAKASPTTSATTKTTPKPTKKPLSGPSRNTKTSPKTADLNPIESIDSDSSFKVPDSGNDSSSSEDEVTTNSKNGEARQNKNQAPESSILQSKQWTQTPPPKPRPSNARLPQFPPQLSAAEAAKARAEKFKPKQPSSLRNVTQMSPLQIEKENQLIRGQFTTHESFDELLALSGVSTAEWERANAIQDNFFHNADPDVIAAVNALPDYQLAEYPLPPSLSLLQGGQSEVEREVEKYFR